MCVHYCWHTQKASCVVDEFASLDQLEDFVGQIMSAGAVTPQMFQLYRAGGDERSRYVALSQIIDLFRATEVIRPEQKQGVLNSYNQRFGVLPAPAPELTVRLTDPSSALFTETQVVRRPGGDPRRQVVEPSGPGRQVADPRVGRQVVSSEDSLFATNVPLEEVSQIFGAEGTDSQRALFDRERENAALQRDRDLQDLNRAQRDAAADNALVDRANTFNQQRALLASSPVAATQGNINSGFARANRGVRNTSFAFDQRRRELQYAQQLRDIDISRQRAQQNFEITQIGIDLQEQVFNDQFNAGILDDGFLDEIEAGQGIADLP